MRILKHNRAPSNPGLIFQRGKQSSHDEAEEDDHGILPASSVSLLTRFLGERSVDRSASSSSQPRSPQEAACCWR
uniref:Uncharacterized protein n=1 Tax=Arundo donax TaxID=35708 RepID=A0A0A8XRT4_ARUDO